jgi:hypothetical protein
MAVLGKEVGSRTVCKSPMLDRISCRIDKSVAEWELQYTGDFDTCGKGKSALLAALVRNVRAETAVVHDKLAACLFNDFEKFFDSIDIDTVMSKAMKMEFPFATLIYILAKHTAPRVIQVSGNLCSRTIPVHCSILPGCKFAIALTRALLAEEYNQLVADHPKVLLSSYVDDSPAYSDGGYDDILNNFKKFSKDFAKACRRLKLKLSGKAGVVCTSERLAKELARFFNSVGVVCSVYLAYRDLGVNFSAQAATRIATKDLAKVSTLHKKVLKNRMHKSQSKLNRITQLASSFKAARKLFSGSGYSSHTWGHQTTGFTPTELVQLERHAANSSGIFPRGRCRFTSLCVAFGPRGHPAGRVIKELFSLWFQTITLIIHKDPEFYHEI